MDDPIKRRDQRLQVLTDGWQEALHSLSDAERGAGPTRVIAATNNNADQLTALTTLLYHYGANGGPEIDIGMTEQDQHRRERRPFDVRRDERGGLGEHHLPPP